MYRKNGTDYNKGVTKAKRKWRDLYAPLYDERKKRNRNDFVHRFDLCEECYDRMVSQFVIPVEKENEV